MKNKINTRIMSLEDKVFESKKSKNLLKQVKSENKKIIRLPIGFSYDYEKMKTEIQNRKNDNI